jgi:hypothetical protein
VSRKKSKSEAEVFMPVRDGHDVSGFTIAANRSAVVLRVHDWTEPLEEPIVTATLSAAEADRLASWLRHFAGLLVLALATVGSGFGGRLCSPMTQADPMTVSIESMADATAFSRPG